MIKDLLLALFMLAIIVFALNAHHILLKEWCDILRNWGR